MALETGDYTSDLVITNPSGADAKSSADDHLRLLKKTIKQTWPNVSSAVTPTHTELNFVDGVTSAIQTQIDSKAPIASPTFTGTPAAPTATLGTNSTQLASTAFVAAAIANVNAQTATVVAVVSGTSQAAVAGSHYILTNVAATTVTLPATPSSGDTVWVTWKNNRADNVVARNGQTIGGDPSNLTLDGRVRGTVALRFVDSSWEVM